MIFSFVINLITVYPFYDNNVNFSFNVVMLRIMS